ncbi:hypothetical protein CLV47_11399 [Antricoccus suffuscus]|uniref:Zn-dependent peptidase n=1 Tax=Antricoccus suffuscus TaxID=1629062 RepID=A0A2T0ZX71_9ACTN|nr:insulinase family protein [Antricoccus suffuscus]PRZ40933.1 hypothetical protein CLV47_11399 [Antricoccus suffuscus]
MSSAAFSSRDTSAKSADDDPSADAPAASSGAPSDTASHTASGTPSGVAGASTPLTSGPPLSASHIFASNAAQRTSVDGVTAFIQPGGGATRASLSFRVGASDEPLPRRGITHLLAHLATNAAGIDSLLTPPTVSASITTFHFEGSAQQVANEIGAVCHWLSSAHDPANISPRTLDRHRDSAYADLVRHAGEHMDLLGVRLGPAGWAAGGLPEYGLANVGPAELSQWAKDFFVQGNAVLALSGTKTTTLRTPLPEGQAQPYRALDVPDLELPAWAPSPQAELSVGGLITLDSGHRDRDRAVCGLVSDIARAHASVAVRRKYGRSFAARSGTLALGDDHVHLALWGRVSDADESGVLAEVLESLRSLAEDGLAEGERAAHVKRRLDAYERHGQLPSGAHELLQRQAIGGLTGTPWSLPLERRLLGTASDVLIEGMITQLAETLIVRSHAPVGGLTPVSSRITVEAPARDAQTHRSRPAYGLLARGRPADERPRRILTDEHALTVRSLDRPDQQIRWNDVAVVESYDDGRRALLSHTSEAIDVRPEDWLHPGDLADVIDARVDPATVAACGVREPVEPRRAGITDRLPVWLWPVLIVVCLALVAAAVVPAWSGSFSWARWVIGAVGFVGLVVVGAFGYDVAMTERRLRKPPKP